MAATRESPKQKKEKSYRPGYLAPVSGIYRVYHTAHRSEHDVLILRGEELPYCRTCKGEVVFQVVQPISHVTHDWDFAGPSIMFTKQHFKRAS